MSIVNDLVMASFIIEGGHRLQGEITPQGAKNEVLQILCATLLTPEKVTVRNVPDILDVNNLISMLRSMGVEVEHLSGGEFSFCARNIDEKYLDSDEFLKLCSSLRGSVMLMGPLLARFGRVLISKPGGDKIGRRRLDTHFLGFQKLGATFNFDQAEEFYSVEGKNLKGCYMLLDEASVTGTANIIMAAVFAEGNVYGREQEVRPLLHACLKVKSVKVREKDIIIDFENVSSIPVTLTKGEGSEDTWYARYAVIPPFSTYSYKVRPLLIDNKQPAFDKNLKEYEVSFVAENFYIAPNKPVAFTVKATR